MKRWKRKRLEEIRWKRAGNKKEKIKTNDSEKKNNHSRKITWTGRKRVREKIGNSKTTLARSPIMQTSLFSCLSPASKFAIILVVTSSSNVTKASTRLVTRSTGIAVVPLSNVTTDHLSEAKIPFNSDPKPLGFLCQLTGLEISNPRTLKLILPFLTLRTKLPCFACSILLKNQTAEVRSTLFSYKLSTDRIIIGFFKLPYNIILRPIIELCPESIELSNNSE